MFENRKLLLVHYQSGLHECVDCAEDVAVDREASGVPGDKRDLVGFSRSQGHADGKVVIDGEPVGLYWVEVADENVDGVGSLKLDGWLAVVDAVVESLVVQNHQDVAWGSFTALSGGHVERCVGQMQVLEGDEP